MVDTTIFNTDAQGNWTSGNSADGTKFGYDRWFWQDDGYLGSPDVLPDGVTATDVANLEAWIPLWQTSHPNGSQSETTAIRVQQVKQAIADWKANNAGVVAPAGAASGGNTMLYVGLGVAAIAAYFLFFNPKKRR